MGLIADLLKVGFSIRQAVNFSDVIYPRHRLVIREIQSQLSGGKSFAKSLRGIVPVDVYYQIYLAEQHGCLQTTLVNIYLVKKTQEANLKKLQTLSYYPIIILVMLGALFIALRLFVYPEFKGLFNYRVPQFVVWGKECVLMIGCSALTLGIIHAYNFMKKTVEQRIIRLCNLPFIGSYFRNYYGYYLCSNIGLLLDQGMSLNNICLMCQGFDKTSFLYQVAFRVHQSMKAGKDLKSTVKAMNYLPNELECLMSKGLPIEQLGQEIRYLGNQLLKKLNRRIQIFLTFVQPTIFILIAVVIVGMYLSVLLPMYQSIQEY